ncbi:MAG: hypothetical protein ABIK83_02095 [Candidatus Zixiibacteriota bacterium]
MTGGGGGPRVPTIIAIRWCAGSFTGHNGSARVDPEPFYSNQSSDAL